MQKNQLRLLMLGAHPDDCDILSGGIAVKYTRLGHAVGFVSMTNGDTGHYSKGGGQLAVIRANEAAEAGKAVGIKYEVFDIHSNGILADIQTRERLISLIRGFKPDVIFTHRPFDYHPDHRKTSMLVQDSSYALIIPNVCPLTPPLKYIPVIMYFYDPFTTDVIVGIDDVFSDKVRMMDCHKSQMYEWLPWVEGKLEDVPAGDIDRMRWLCKKQMERDSSTARCFRPQLIQRYGEEKAGLIKVAEAFELCEYGRKPEMEQMQELFPF